MIVLAASAVAALGASARHTSGSVRGIAIGAAYEHQASVAEQTTPQQALTRYFTEVKSAQAPLTHIPVTPNSNGDIALLVKGMIKWLGTTRDANDQVAVRLAALIPPAALSAAHRQLVKFHQLQAAFDSDWRTSLQLDGPDALSPPGGQVIARSSDWTVFCSVTSLKARGRPRGRRSVIFEPFWSRSGDDRIARTPLTF